MVTLKVYDLTGKEVVTLIDGTREAGEHAVVVDGSKLGSGVYYYQLQTRQHAATRKMILLK